VAAELKQVHGVEARLVEGRGGVFVIRRDGAVVYDKAETGRFPSPGAAARPATGGLSGSATRPATGGLSRPSTGPLPTGTPSRPPTGPLRPGTAPLPTQPRSLFDRLKAWSEPPAAAAPPPAPPDPARQAFDAAVAFVKDVLAYVSPRLLLVRTAFDTTGLPTQPRPWGVVGRAVPQAVQAAGTRDADAVMAKMRELPTNDFMTSAPRARPRWPWCAGTGRGSWMPRRRPRGRSRRASTPPPTAPRSSR